jgi:hypothetical protein
MQSRLICAFVAVMGVLGGSAAAQDAGKVGITMGYPASIGLIWHASDSIAIRPELTFSGSSAESDGPGIVGGESWAVATGVSALFYMKKYDNLRTYFTPRFTYARTSSTTDISSITTSSSTSRSRTIGGAGSFGAQYALGDKFSVFGEVGFGLMRSTSSSSFSSGKSKITSWGTRAGAGVIYYP